MSAPGTAQERPTPARDSTPRDTVKRVIALPARPRGPLTEGAFTTWDREAIFASGAFTLGELIAQVPGGALHVASFLGGVSATSWYGEPGRVRVFVDGVEIDVLDPRLGGTADLSIVQLWTMEEVVLERGAGELRAHLRTWRVRLTTPSTRTDVVTGSENANLYRGFFGRRFNRGGVLQIAGQQYSTSSFRTRGDGDALAAFLRMGTVRGRWTIDATFSRFGRSRAPTRRYVVTGTTDPNAIGRFSGRDLTAALRAAYGDVDAEGWWLQMIAATIQHVEDDSLASSATVPDPDTVVTQGQFVGAVGLNRGPLRVSGTARYRTQHGSGRLSPSVRASYAKGWLSASGYLEQGGPDSTARLDASLRLRPLSWFHAMGAVSRHTPESALSGGPVRQNFRAEVGVSGRGRSVTAGLIHRSSARVSGLFAFDSVFTPTTIGASTGFELGLGGQIVGPFSFAFRAIDWTDDALYRPEHETHAEVRVGTDLRRQLPRRTFYLSAAFTHDWTGTMLAPDGLGGTLRAAGASYYGTLLDIRIGTAHIFWYNRNFSGKVYETVPGYLAPRLIQLYGVRWEFWN